MTGTVNETKGFTLIEVLISLTIISLVVGLTTLSFAQVQSRTADDYLLVNKDFFEKARTWSQIRNTAHRIEFKDDQLQLYSQANSEWQLKEVQNTSASAELVLSSFRDNNGLIFLPSGRYTPFSFGDEGAQTGIKGEGNSAIQILSEPGPTPSSSSNRSAAP